MDDVCVEGCVIENQGCCDRRRKTTTVAVGEDEDAGDDWDEKEGGRDECSNPGNPQDHLLRFCTNIKSSSIIVSTGRVAVLVKSVYVTE
ncbi:hypothetical protein Tco_1440831 [Tanacetum coccineum]